MHMQTNRPWQGSPGTFFKRNYLTWAIRGSGLNRKQTDVRRVGPEREESKCHENFHVVCIIFHGSDRPHDHFSYSSLLWQNTIWLCLLALISQKTSSICYMCYTHLLDIVFLLRKQCKLWAGETKLVLHSVNSDKNNIKRYWMWFSI